MKGEDENRSQLVRRLREKYPTTNQLNLQFARCRVLIKMNDPELKKTLEHYFKAFLIAEITAKLEITVSVHQANEPLDFPYQVKQPDPGKTTIKEEFFDLDGGRVVRKRLTGMHFIFGDNDNLAIGPCRENSNQVINFINNRFIEYKLRKNWLLGHAAAVLYNGRGLALAGFSGMGKSTLALHLMSMGTVFISNDRLMITKADKGVIMSGVAKLPRVNPGTVLNNDDLKMVMPSRDKAINGQLSPEELWSLEQKYDVDIESCYGLDKFRLSGSMDGLVILNWQRNSEPLSVNIIDLRQRRDLLRAFIKATGLFYLPGAGADNFAKDFFSEDNYLEHLNGITVLEMSGGVDFERAAQYCFDFLKSGNPGSGLSY